MKQLKTQFEYFMQRHFKRYRLRKICQALDIVPYPFQRDFAMGKKSVIPWNSCIRADGKTMAVMLRLLMAMPGEPCDVLETLRKDPNFTNERMVVLNVYTDEYNRLAHKCNAAGVPVNKLQLHKVYKVI